MSRMRSGLWTALTMIVAALVAVAPAQAQVEPATDWKNYDRVLLTTKIGEPVDLWVMPDNRVLHTGRGGEVFLTDPARGGTKQIAHIPVYYYSEGGLSGVALDPDFATNKWVYLHYSPFLASTPAGNAPAAAPANVPDSEVDAYWQSWMGYDVLARFKFDEATETLDLATKQEILRIPTMRGGTQHTAGDIDFDAQGNLYLSTGANDNSGASGGYAPIDDRPRVNPSRDARRTSANTNNLLGKVLRFKVNPDGSYSIPPGNLFTPGTMGARPEIYVMGLRNPYKISVDDPTGALAIAEYGPDAGTSSATKGPMGYVEWSTTTTPFNAGWPFCHGSDTDTVLPNIAGQGPFGGAYNDWDYTTNTQGPWYDCDNPVNDSRFNTGLRELPPIRPSQAFYGDRETETAWPEFVRMRGTVSSGQSPMAGPRYRYDPANPSPSKLPQYWDGKWMFAEFDGNYLAALTHEGAAGPLTKVEPFLPNNVLLEQGDRPHDHTIALHIGPDGALYTLDYGAWLGGASPASRANPELSRGLYRIDWSPGNRAPKAAGKATPASSSAAPLTVEFDGRESRDPEGGALRYEWDFDADGVWDATTPVASHTYTAIKGYEARLRVTDPTGRTGATTVAVSVGNTAPTLAVDSPVNGGFFDWGNAIPYSVTASDAESTISCTPVAGAGGFLDPDRLNKVLWLQQIGHNQHAHAQNAGSGCTGAITTPAQTGHGPGDNTFSVLDFSVTDSGAAGVPSATTKVSLQLNPKDMEAEYADAQQGVELPSDTAASGGAKVSSLDPGDWIAFDPVNLLNIDSLRTVASGAGTLALRWNSPTAEPFATIAVPAGGNWQTVTTPLASAPVGTGRLYVTSTGGTEIDSFSFVGAGVADKTPPIVTATLNPSTPSGENGWHTGNVVLTLAATDNGAVGSRQYSLNGGTTWTNTANNGTATLNVQGVNTVLYRATDTGGNVSAVGGPIVVRRDTVAPVTTATTSPAQAGSNGWFAGPPTVSLSATDASSGLAKTEYTLDGGEWTTYTGPFTVAGYGDHVVQYRSVDQAGLIEATQTLSLKVATTAPVTGNVGGSVPATLSLSLGAPASFGAFTPGVAREYLASTTANVISTAGDAALSVADPSASNTGKLVNGAFALAQPLQANASNAASPAGPFAAVAGSASPTRLLSYSSPVSNDAVTIGFKQAIGATDGLRTGNYSKTLTFTLSTTTP